MGDLHLLVVNFHYLQTKQIFSWAIWKHNETTEMKWKQKSYKNQSENSNKLEGLQLQYMSFGLFTALSTSAAVIQWGVVVVVGIFCFGGDSGSEEKPNRPPLSTSP